MSILQTKLRIRFYGDAHLRKRAKPVKEVTDKERAVLDEMAELMHLGAGIGLAAPQVGVDKQMLIADIGEGLVILINPRIAKKSGSMTLEEGCLSLPGIYVKIKRPRKIVVTGLNEHNEKVTMAAQDLSSRVIQHEIDHLRGRLIIDYASLIKRISLRKKLKNLQKGVADGLL